jgi:hypothetical protein
MFIDEISPATVVLEDIINSLSHDKYMNTMEHFNIGDLITAELQKLIVPTWYRYNYEQFLNFFPKLEKLQALVLCHSNIDNSCLKIIGTWCKNLRYF